MSAILEADSVSMAVGVATLVDQVDLRIEGGEAVAIVGPNGAGKSTLLRLLSGDLRPTGGTVRLKQRALHAYAPRSLAQHRAMLSQHVSVTFPFTVEEIVTMGAGESSRAAAKPRVDAALHEVGLTDFRNRKLPTLSGGEQQRAHLARVLVQLACGEASHGPGVLLLDEPTSSLDLRHQIDLVEIARRRAREGTAVAAVLHDLNLAVHFADRVIVLHQGGVAIDGHPREMMTTGIMSRVFDVDAAIQTTDDGLPFVLPQTMRPLATEKKLAG